MSKTNNCKIIRQIKGQITSDGDGVKICRLIGGAELSDLDPFLLFDEFISDNPDEYIGGFPEHPHRGFETVTYMLAGKMRHEDNQGNKGILAPGDVQWMTAGKGIIHSEMPEQENGLMWGFQLWVNLPSKSKMTQPHYQDITSDTIPTDDRTDGVSIRVIAGKYNNLTGPIVNITTEPLYLDISLEAGVAASIAIPTTHNRLLYCYSGTIHVGDTIVERGSLAVLSNDATLSMRSEKLLSSAILFAGLPIREPIVRYGPFVMNTHEEIRQAIYDSRTGFI
tara:strand:- start:403 stop:1242 length:840 start_codon:yes stop_codon:yes gene_type:complete